MAVFGKKAFVLPGKTLVVPLAIRATSSQLSGMSHVMILRIADARSDEVVADVMDREAYDAYCCEMIVLSLSIVARVALALVLVRAAETEIGRAHV